MSTVARPHLARTIHRSLLTSSLVVVLVGAGVLLASPITAQAASRAPHASSVCAKVSAASVSAIVGYKVPAATEYTIPVKPSKADYEVTGSDVICTYGAETSMATIVKAVSLSLENINKPLTSAEMQASIAKATKDAKFTFSPYPGLGGPAFYFKLVEVGITGQGLSLSTSSTHFAGVSVESSKITKSQLASLVKLAETL
jgi:hypothetical protein